MNRSIVRLAFGLAMMAVGTATEVSAEEYWGAIMTGQSRPDANRVVYPFDLYGVAWNFSTPQAAKQAALEECRKRGQNCGKGLRSYLFSTSSDAAVDYLKARCVIVVIAPNPSLSGLREVYAYTGEHLPDSLPSDMRIRLQRHSPEVYCNSR